MTFHRDDVSSVLGAARIESPRALVGQLAVALAVSVYATACASGEASDSLTREGEQASELAQSVAESGAALTITIPAPEYFSAVRDVRRCVSPLCGGYFVRAVNRPLTRCANGTFAERCYVAELDSSVFGEAPPELGREAVLRGRIESRVFPTFGNLGQFVATEAFSSATQALGTGAYFRLGDTVVRCITDPCFSISAELLNTSLAFRISSLDLSAVGADAEAQERAVEALADANLVAAGRLRMRSGTAGIGLELVSSQFYLPLGERCFSNADCAPSEHCNATEICLPPPGCGRGEPCLAVCTGYCVSGSASCAQDADCPSGSWCRATEAGGRACVPFAEVGETCNGFTLPWAYEQCSPELVCDTPEFIADASGICRVPCKSNADCSASAYCATDSLCHPDGTCDRSLDCASEGNEYVHILCVGHPACSESLSNGSCGWRCRDPRCLDLYGADFGSCDAILGWAVVRGQCTQLSGCSAGDFQLFASQADCESACTP